MSNNFGTINNPLNTLNPNNTYQDVTYLPVFISNLLKLITIGAGLFAMVNFILAGFAYMTSAGDQKKLADALAKINFSIIGLAIIAVSYVLTGVISYIIFGSPTTILKPVIYGPGSI